MARFTASALQVSPVEVAGSGLRALCPEPSTQPIHLNPGNPRFEGIQSTKVFVIDIVSCRGHVLRQFAGFGLGLSVFFLRLSQQAHHLGVAPGGCHLGSQRAQYLLD